MESAPSPDGAKLTKDLAALWADRGYKNVLDHDCLHVLLDRWREIVRRAIGARLMLGWMTVLVIRCGG
jgi:hypothetical protein